MEGTGVLINALAFIFRKRFSRDAVEIYVHVYVHVYFARIAREKEEAREKAWKIASINKVAAKSFGRVKRIASNAYALPRCNILRLLATSNFPRGGRGKATSGQIFFVTCIYLSRRPDVFSDWLRSLRRKMHWKYRFHSNRDEILQWRFRDDNFVENGFESITF